MLHRRNIGAACKIKMLAQMKERFPSLARQPRPKAPQLAIGWCSPGFCWGFAVEELVMITDQ